MIQQILVFITIGFALYTIVNQILKAFKKPKNKCATSCGKCSVDIDSSKR